jgi:hypothetical protein
MEMQRRLLDLYQKYVDEWHGVGDRLSTNLLNNKEREYLSKYSSVA